MTAVHILNRSPTKALDGKTPYKVWHGRKPAVGYLCIFGCLAFAKELNHVGKLGNRSTPGVFIGYDDGAKAYRILDPVTQRMCTTHNVVFDEGRGWALTGAADGVDALTFSDFTVEYAHFEEARGAESPSSPTSSASSSQGWQTKDPGSGVSVSPDPGEDLQGRLLDPARSAGSAGSPSCPTRSPMLLAAPSLDAAPTETTTSPTSTTTPPSPPLAVVDPSPSLVEFVIPLPDDEDRLNINYHSEPLRYRTMDNILGVPELHQVCGSDGEPRSFAEANEQEAWRAAIEKEMEAVKKNDT